MGGKVSSTTQHQQRERRLHRCGLEGDVALAPAEYPARTHRTSQIRIAVARHARKRSRRPIEVHRALHRRRLVRHNRQQRNHESIQSPPQESPPHRSRWASSITWLGSMPGRRVLMAIPLPSAESSCRPRPAHACSASPQRIRRRLRRKMKPPQSTAPRCAIPDYFSGCGDTC